MEQTVDRVTLDRDVMGTVVAPGEEDWDQARAAWNLAADQHPAAVVYVESASDVVTAVAPRVRAGWASPRRAPGTGRARAVRWTARS